MSLFETIQRAITGKALNPVDDSRGWYPLVRESYSGAWQQGVTVNHDHASAFHAVFTCVTLIAGDAAKLRLKVIHEGASGVWNESPNHAYASLLAKPNGFQTRNQFIEHWVLSRLMRGNAYALKQRNGSGLVTALYVLDPSRVQPLVSDDGSIYYRLQTDNLSGLGETVVVPARELIHDRWNTLFHPLVGLSPIYACGLAATHGLAMQNSATSLFQNAARPGGLLVAPGRIDQESADRLKAHWDSNFTGGNAGKIAVLGDGLKYEALSLTAEEAQLIDQLRWSAEVVAACFHVPKFLAGIGEVPSLGSIEALTGLYYATCLQAHLEAIESCLDEGLGFGRDTGVEFDLDSLMRMDTSAKMKALSEGVGGSILSPNEARKRLDLPPVDGGNSPMAQQQDFALSALAERDRNKPFSKPGDPSAPVAD